MEAPLAMLQISLVFPCEDCSGYQWGLPVYLLVSRLELMKEQIWQAKVGGCVGIQRHLQARSFGFRLSAEEALLSDVVRFF